MPERELAYRQAMCEKVANRVEIIKGVGLPEACLNRECALLKFIADQVKEVEEECAACGVAIAR